MASASERPGAGYLIFQDYENGQYIYRNQLNSLLNYLAGNVIAIWNPNRSYYYDWPNESNNLQIVGMARALRSSSKRKIWRANLLYT